MTRRPGKSRAPRSSDPIPADVLLTLADLKIEVEKINGDEGWALCPGPHAQTMGKQDHKASWSINLETGQHHCFSCGWGGPFIVLVKWMYDWEDKDEKAEEWIRRHGGIGVAKKKLQGLGGFEKKQAEAVTEADLALFTDPPLKALNSRDVDVESCREYGVLWDPEKEQWIFPIRDPYDNHLMGWQAKNKRLFLNYPDHVEKAHTLFGFHLLDGLDTAYLYEAPIDPVRMHTYGLDGAVSSFGVHVSDTQLSLLADTVDTLYLCLDNDAAGRKMERQIWTDWRHAFRRLMFVNYDHTRLKDHGEMAIEDVEWSINNAISAVRYRPC
jgi:hypothetical protein